MIGEGIRRITVGQNDQDAAADRLPSRHIEDDLAERRAPALAGGRCAASTPAEEFDFAAWVRQSRASQGLPETVEDMDTLNRAARLLLPRLMLSNGSARGSGRSGTSPANAGKSGRAGQRPSRPRDVSGRA